MIFSVEKRNAFSNIQQMESIFKRSILSGSINSLHDPPMYLNPDIDVHLVNQGFLILEEIITVAF